MATTRKDLPEDLDALRVVLIAERARAAELAVAKAKAKASDDAATIAHQRVQIEKLSRQLYGHGSERTVRLLDQMELAFEELESSASEDEIAAERKLYEAERKPGPMVEAACWVHARRPLLILADLAANARRRARGKTASVISPVALEAVRRIDALFYIEHSINGQSTERRWQVRREVSAPLVADLERWLRDKRPKLSRGNDLARAMDYLLKRWPAFTRFLDDGRIYLSNNAAERALRGIALGRKS
jgi:hypothetical protein